jgi:flagellar hook-associated protein 1 FlgK
MSQIASIEVKEDKNGAVDVYLGGENMIHKTECRELDTIMGSGGSSSDKLYVVIKGKNSPISLTKGGLSGLMESRDGYLSDTRGELDHLAEVFVEKVNEIHRRGWTPSGSGFDFFDGVDAGTIEISGAITNNLNLIASSYDGTVGDNSLANDVAALSEVNISAEEPMTINDLYQSTVAALGIHSMKAQGMVKNEQLIMDNLEMRKESITGVSLDEELINLSKYQNSYEAAAKVLSTINELIETILEM